MCATGWLFWQLRRVWWVMLHQRSACNRMLGNCVRSAYLQLTACCVELVVCALHLHHCMLGLVASHGVWSATAAVAGLFLCARPRRVGVEGQSSALQSRLACTRGVVLGDAQRLGLCELWRICMRSVACCLAPHHTQGSCLALPLALLWRGCMSCRVVFPRFVSFFHRGAPTFRQPVRLGFWSSPPHSEDMAGLSRAGFGWFLVWMEGRDRKSVV